MEEKEPPRRIDQHYFGCPSKARRYSRQMTSTRSGPRTKRLRPQVGMEAVCEVIHQGHGATPDNSRRWVSASSMSRSLINIDGQDKQDGLLMVWAACSGTRVFTPLSSTITFTSTRIPKTRSQATGSLQTRTRSSSESASGATASRPVYPVYPVYRCSLMQQTGLTGHGPYSRQAIRIRCFTLE